MSNGTDDEAVSASYEVLGSGACNAPLPQNPIVRELNFGRFITLADAAIPPAGVIAGVAAKVVLPLHAINAFLAPRQREQRCRTCRKKRSVGRSRGQVASRWLMR